MFCLLAWLCHLTAGRGHTASSREVEFSIFHETWCVQQLAWFLARPLGVRVPEVSDCCRVLAVPVSNTEIAPITVATLPQNKQRPRDDIRWAAHCHYLPKLIAALLSTPRFPPICPQSFEVPL